MKLDIYEVISGVENSVAVTTNLSLAEELAMLVYIGSIRTLRVDDDAARRMLETFKEDSKDA